MLDKLEFMIALSREQHFGRAAEACGVAQPTLSLGIQSLEEMFNAPLVKRASRFQGFTPEGERLLVWAHRLVGDARAMRQDILGEKSEIGSHLRIAAIPSAMPLVAKLTVPLQARHPSMRFTVLGRTSTALLNMLRQREIEVGVTYLSNEPIGDVSAIPIYREEYLLLTTAGGPLGDVDRVTWSQAAEAPLCLLARDMQSRRIVDSIFETYRHRANTTDGNRLTERFDCSRPHRPVGQHHSQFGPRIRRNERYFESDSDRRT